MINFSSQKDSLFNELNKIYESQALVSDSEKIPETDKSELLWSVKVPVDNFVFGFDTLNLVIGIPNDFPLVLPKIYLPKSQHDNLQYLPHIDQHRLICTFDEERAVPDPQQPIGIILTCLRQAKKIIESGIKSENFEDYQDEYIAYWGQTYNKEKLLDDRMLSLISDKLELGQIVDLLLLDKLFGKYNSALLSQCDYSRRFHQFLKEENIHFVSYKALYAGTLSFEYPPFKLHNRELQRFIQKKNVLFQKQFDDFLDRKQDHNVILFNPGIEGHTNLLGLKIQKLPTSANGFRKDRLTPALAFRTVAANKGIQRILPDPIHNQRLQMRTTGLKANSKGQKRFAIAGLGSVGSNLMYFLSSLSDVAFHLIDHDEITSENIARHFLGLNYTGSMKVAALKQFYEYSNPNNRIQTSTDSIVQVINENSDDLNACDVLFVCIGKWNIDRWISEAVDQGKIKIPVCFLWVEPYLLGGHALYIHPKANRFLEFFEDNGMFKKNVIAPDEYQRNNPLLSLRESGCQSSYSPYSKNKVIKYLSKLYPHLELLISNKPVKSEAYTWIGSEEVELKGKIQIEEWAKNTNEDLSILRI